MTQSPIHPDNAEERVPSAPIRGGRESGSAYWRSLDHVADTDEFREYMHREFPKGASELMSDDRRTFLKVMGASFALAGIGLGGCRRWPVEEIAPYANRPEGRIPGEAVKYATAWDFAGRGVPLLAESMSIVKVSPAPTVTVTPLFIVIGPAAIALQAAPNVSPIV